MIISHTYKYLFIQLPLTASTSIGRELCDYYEGQEILNKHSHCHDFLGIANREEKKYFIFSCIRNPLDVVVSRYFKLKTNHEGAFTNPKYRKRNGGWVTNYDLYKFSFIHNNNADFPTFFKKHYRFAYDNWNSLTHRRFNFMIRFENLQHDFSKVLRLVGIKQKRPLPIANETEGRENDPFLYYTAEIQDQAKRVFGPFMRKWGYSFPSEWGNYSIPWHSFIEFRLLGIIRRFYWRYFGRIDLPQILIDAANALEPVCRKCVGEKRKK